VRLAGFGFPSQTSKPRASLVMCGVYLSSIILAVFVKIVVFNEIQSNSLNSQQFVQMFSNIKDVGRPFCVIPDVRDCCALWL